MPLTKYFIAIIPPEPVFSEIESIKQTVSVNYNNKSALRAPAHITLHKPFEWKEEKENLLIEKLGEFKSPNTFQINLKNYSSFEPKVLFIDVLKNDSLTELQKNLVQHVKISFNVFNEADNKRNFHPHITIAFRDLKKDQFYKAREEYQQKLFEAAFDYEGFYLMKHENKRWLASHKFV